MKKILAKNKLYILATLLCVIFLAIFIIMPFTNTKAFAEENTSSDEIVFDEETEELLNDYLTNSDISDEDLEVANEYVVENFGEYVYVEDGYAVFDEENAPCETEDDVTIIEMINTYTSLMNDLVEEDYGYIDETEIEFVLDEDKDEDFTQLWRAWGLSVKWNKLTAYFDKDYAAIFSILFLTIDALLLTDSIMDAAKAVGNANTVEQVLVQAAKFVSSDLAGVINNVLNSKALAVVVEYGGYALALLTAGNAASEIVFTVLSIIASITIPSISDCASILILAIAYNKSIQLKFCWIPWFGDKWGFTIKSL